MSLTDRWNRVWSDIESVPWDINAIDHNLIDYISALDKLPSNALDVGCGTGNNAIWLSKQGISMTAIDIAQVPIDKAKEADSNVNFLVQDLLEYKDKLGSYEFIFDSGCFHSFNYVNDQEKFVSRISDLLTIDGCWLSIIGSTEGVHPKFGPPRRSLLDIVKVIEPKLEIVSVVSTTIFMPNNNTAPAWKLLMRKRAIAPTPWVPKTLCEQGL